MSTRLQWMLSWQRPRSLVPAWSTSTLSWLWGAWVRKASEEQAIEHIHNSKARTLPGRVIEREEDCRKEIAIEARIYQRVGEHPRLVKLKGWDPQAHILMLEYMPNGTLEDYVKLHHGHISMDMCLRWIAQAADALHLLHSMGVIHCDVGPHNLFLDADMNFKITDFSGSSIDGKSAMVCPGTRYNAPDPHWRPGKPPTVKEDLFSLGSTTYYIVMGKAPFDQLPDEEVERKYLNREFPDLAGVPFGEIIKLCWLQEAQSALLVRELVGKVNIEEGL